MNACKLVGLLLLLLWGHTALYAQQVRTVRGRVQTVEAGSNEKRALPSASIVILAKSDSAFIKGITSDKNGRFILNYQPQKKKKYLLKVSFMGMQSVYRALEDSVSVNIGTVVLKDDDIQISEVAGIGGWEGDEIYTGQNTGQKEKGNLAKWMAGFISQWKSSGRWAAALHTWAG